MIVELTKGAQSDIEKAALEYEHAREGLGLRFESELDRTMERIAQNPFQFPGLRRTDSWRTPGAASG